MRIKLLGQPPINFVELGTGDCFMGNGMGAERVLMVTDSIGDYGRRCVDLNVDVGKCFSFNSGEKVTKVEVVGEVVRGIKDERETN